MNDLEKIYNIPKLIDQFELFIKLIAIGDEKAYNDALEFIKQLRKEINNTVSNC